MSWAPQPLIPTQALSNSLPANRIPGWLMIRHLQEFLTNKDKSDTAQWLIDELVWGLSIMVGVDYHKPFWESRSAQDSSEGSLPRSGWPRFAVD